MVEKVKAMVLDGMTAAEIARQVSTPKHPITRQAVSAFIKRHQAELAVTQAKVVQAVEDYLIAHKVNRIAALDDRWQRIRRVIDQRAADGAKNWQGVPGMDTGIVVHQLKQIGAGKNAMTVDEFVVDTGTLAEARAIEKAAADELGQIQQRPSGDTYNIGQAVIVREYGGGFDPKVIE